MSFRTAIRGCVFFLWLATRVTAQQRDADLDRYSDQARQALAAKEWDKAARALEHLAQLAPSVAEVHANLGLAFFFEGRAVEALAAFDRAAKLNPALPQVGVMAGLCKAELGRHREAIEILAPAFDHPADEETGRLIGLHLQRSYAELKEFDKAQAIGEDLLKRYPKDPEILYQVSRLHADRSYGLMKQLIEAAPDSYWVHIANAQVQESLGRYDLAQQEYRKSIARNPAVPGAHYGLGRAILNGPRDPHAVDEAAREFERELALAPQNAQAEFELGEIARERGQLDAARDHLSKAVRYNPDLFEAQIGLARLLLKQGSPRDAVRHLEQAARRSLETWNHGAALAQAVRLVRLTRPEIVMTWLPVYVAGENHGDHQAAGVIVTEAFDVAGDATAFPEQIAPPRDRQNISNLTEGLHPWQPKKLYYFSDASHTDFLEGKGPHYSTKDVSPSRGVPYYRLAAEEMTFHLTQDDTGQLARQAIAKGDFKYFEQPVLLVFGKSVVKSSVSGDIFDGIADARSAFAPVHGYREAEKDGLSLELGGPWSFYREFWKAHGIDHLATLLPAPEVAIAPGERLHLPLLIHNGTGEPRQVTLSATTPGGWQVVAGQAIYPVAAHETYPVETVLGSPTQGDPAWQTVVWKAESAGQTIGTIPTRVNLATGGLPQ